MMTTSAKLLRAAWLAGGKALGALGGQGRGGGLGEEQEHEAGAGGELLVGPGT